MPSDSGRGRYRPWNVLALVLLGRYLVGLVLLSLGALTPRSLSRPPWRSYAEQTAWWPILIQIVFGAGAFVAYWWPRRKETRSFSLLFTSGLAITTIGLGLVTYWNCAEGQSALWTPLTWALNLVGGSVQPGTCGGTPMSLQVARLFGPLTLVIAALGIVATIFQSQYDRLRVRYAQSLVVLIGLTEDAVPLLRRLSGELNSRTTLAVMVEDAGNPLVKQARDFGARVVVCDLDDAVGLRILVTSRSRFKVRALYAVSADVSVNLAWAARFRTMADTNKPQPGDLPPRMIVRIDDPWQAEYWRRTNAYRTPVPGKQASVRWMSDALSVYEVTATLLLDRIQGRAFDRLVIVGNSPLALAVCAELAQREREGHLLGEHPKPSFAELILFGPDAEPLRQQHRLRQERFGNTAGKDPITVVLEEATSPNLQAVLKDDHDPVLILADDPAQVSTQVATYLAALHPGWTIFDWSPATRGVGVEPIMERLYTFGLTTDALGTWPVDSWERAARIVHESYRRTHVITPDPAVPSHRPWDAGLDPFVRESNVRLVTTTLASAEAVGRSWGPVASDTVQGVLDASMVLDHRQLEKMAAMEHESWMQHHRDHGWRPGSPRDDQRKIHPALVAWDFLDDLNRDRTRSTVRAALFTLEGLGYRSTIIGANAWIRVQRVGEVRATPGEENWQWSTTSGEQLRGKAGDWRVTGPEGNSWSVTPEIFAQTYTHIEGDRWRRTGEAVARVAVEGEVIESLEGPQTAHRGEWVIKGTAGELWVISAENFAQTYAPLPTAADSPPEPDRLSQTA
jgi:hypothetical protein